MSMGLAYGGQGFIQGMEMSRQHRRQDTQDERAEELYGLKTDRMRSDMAHNEEMRPLQREQAEVGLEGARLGLDSTRAEMDHQETMRPMEAEGAALGLQGTRADLDHRETMRPLEVETAQYGLRQAEQGVEQGDMQLEAERRAEQTEKYLRRFAAGDAGALQDWYNQYGPNNIEEIGRTKDGEYHLIYDDGDEEVVSMDELGERMAAMLDPEMWLAEMTAEPEPAEQRWHETSDGHLYDRRSGQTMTREEMGLPSIESVDSGRLDSSTFNSMERVLHRFWGNMNEAGQFILPEGSQENYAKSVERGEALIMSGMPTGQAAYIASMSLSGPLDEDEARRQATKEAREEGVKTPGVFSGGDQEWLDQRTQEIMEESREADRIYHETVGGERGQRGLRPEAVGQAAGESGAPFQQESASAIADPEQAERPSYGLTGDMAARGDLTGRGFETGSARQEAPGAGGQDRPSAPSGNYVAPDGEVVRPVDIETTMRNHGMTAEEVIERLGLQPQEGANEAQNRPQTSNPAPGQSGARERPQGPGRIGPVRGQGYTTPGSEEPARGLSAPQAPRPEYRGRPDTSGIREGIEGLRGSSERRVPDTGGSHGRSGGVYTDPDGNQYSAQEIRKAARENRVSVQDIIRANNLHQAGS